MLSVRPCLWPPRPPLTRRAVFTSTGFTGEPRETDEMYPEWFDASLDAIPFDKMWWVGRLGAPGRRVAVEGRAVLHARLCLLQLGLWPGVPIRCHWAHRLFTRLLDTPCCTHRQLHGMYSALTFPPAALFRASWQVPSSYPPTLPGPTTATGGPCSCEATSRRSRGCLGSPTPTTSAGGGCARSQRGRRSGTCGSCCRQRAQARKGSGSAAGGGWQSRPVALCLC